MQIDFTFEQVCEFLKEKEDDPKLIQAVDKLLGMTLICSPIILGPDALPALSLLSTKNELIRIGKDVFNSITKKDDSDFLARQRRMGMAYVLICYTAFFEAIDRLLRGVPDLPALTASAQEILSKQALKKMQPERKVDARDDDLPPRGTACLPIPFPHPVDSFDNQTGHLEQLYNHMAKGFSEFLEKSTNWRELKKETKDRVSKAIEELPGMAMECFYAQYLELARKYEDFFVWSSLHEHKSMKAAIESLSDYVKQHATLARPTRKAIDIGFARLQKAVQSVPEQIKKAQAVQVIEGLARHYEARINDPIIEDTYEPEEGKPALSFPKIRDAFIPQSYQVLRQTTKERRLEKEETWEGLERKDNLGAFLLKYLSSPYSLDAPLIILGHPGCGKSLLTRVLSARLMSEFYTPIRVPLREVDSEAAIENQIEEEVNRITKDRISSWASFSGNFEGNPPVVILDGYDELLQASGRIFSNYLWKVKNFQQSEAELGRPVRVIVTSRIALIGKATIPEGATVLRLLEFSEDQRSRWISIWNRENEHYFRACKDPEVKPFELPEEESIINLAEQPLLLLMLALYDSDGNKLRKRKGLDRTFLYDSLLRRFIERERNKSITFQDLSETNRQEEIDRDMRRLGVAAIGMYNRRKLHILASELNEDLSFFELERDVQVENGRPLTQADMLLGSFFFVHKSTARQRGDAVEHYEESTAFEFLHNTFGEFLTADFILRHALEETQLLSEMKKTPRLRAELLKKLAGPDSLSEAWFACLMYTPLYSRPVVLEMIREWIGHSLSKRKRKKTEFLDLMDEIILNQIGRILRARSLPSIMTVDPAPPFGDYPLLGHIATYSVNLIILRTIFAQDDGYIFPSEALEPYQEETEDKDRTDPWGSLTHIWRSWFSIDSLNGLTAILSATHENSSVVLYPRKSFSVATSGDRLGTVLNVSMAIGDNITTGLAGLLLYDPNADNRIGLDSIQHCLRFEELDLEINIMVKQIREQVFRHDADDDVFARTIYNALQRSIRTRNSGALLELTAMMWGTQLLRRLSSQPRYELMRAIFSPEFLMDWLEFSPYTAIEMLRLIPELRDTPGLERFSEDYVRDLLEHMLRPRNMIQLMEMRPYTAIDILRLIRELGGTRWLERFSESYAQELLERVFHSGHMMELMKMRPEAAIEMLRLIRELASTHGLERFSEDYVQELLEHMLSPRHMMELMEMRPGAAIEMLQLIRQLSGTRWMEQLSESYQDLLERMLSPRHMMELMEMRPGVAIERLQLIRGLSGTRWLERFPEDYVQELFERLLHPDRMMDLTEMRPDAAVEMLRLIRELASIHGLEGFSERYAKELLERILHPRGMMELIEIHPDSAIEVLQFATGSRSLHMVEQSFRMLFAEFEEERLMLRFYRHMDSFLAFLRFARLANAGKLIRRAVLLLPTPLWSGEIRTSDPGSLRLGPADRDSRVLFADIGKIPLESVSDLRWFAELTEDRALLEALSEYLA